MTSRPVLSGLAAPLDGALPGQIAEVWDSIETALRAAHERGWDFAQSLIADAIGRAGQLIEDAGDRSRELQALLCNRIHAYPAVFTRFALKNVATALEIGDQRLCLSHVHVTQKLVLGGSLKANLTEVFTLTSSGDLAVQVDYGPQSSSAGSSPP